MRPFSCALLLLLALAGCNSGGPPPGLVGKPAPSIAIPGASPSDPLAALRGKVVVLNFWASWCAPCLLEFPSLAALQRDLPGITVLAVSFDQSPPDYQRFLERHPVALHTALDASGRSNAAFGTTRPPETWVIDKRGTVRRRFVGAQEWTTGEIEEYLRSLERE